nr:glycoside hydrolase TIM-barrel-like domain-containing protein [Rickettsia tamurae]
MLHYAQLVKDYVDAFIIGSELIGITSIKDAANNFPAVNELCNLAHLVKK